MTWHLWVCSWLAHAALGSLLLLTAGCLAVSLCRQPVRRLRLIELTLFGCLLVPWLSQAPGLPHWSFGWLTLPAEEAASPIAGITLAAEPEYRAPNQPADVVLVAGNEQVDTVPAPARSEAGPVSASSKPREPDLAAGGTSSGATPLPVAPPSVPVVVALGYAGIALGLGLWWLVGAIKLLRLRAGAAPAPQCVMDLFRQVAGPAGERVRLLVSDRLDLPVTFRGLRPVILLPAALCRDDDAAALRYGLAHEWSHVERHDLWLWYLASVAQFVFFYQPLLWWLRRQLRLCQDFVADARAAEQAPSAEDYAAYLVSLARRRLGAPAPVALGIGDRRSNLYRRVLMLIHNRQPLERRCLGLWSLGTTLAALALVLLVAGVRLDAGDPPAKDVPKKDTVKEEAKKPDQGQSVTYTGEVVEKNTKKPIEGATVTVRRTLYGDPEVKGEKTIQETKHPTDAKGKFTFTIPPEQASKRYLYIELDVTHPKYAPRTGFGYSFAMIQKNEKMGGRPFFEHTELWPGEEISGQVQTPDGKPAVGVKVLTFSKPTSNDFREFGSFGYGKTDDRGVFRVTVVKGGPAVFWLLPKDYAPSLHTPKDKRGDLGVFGLTSGIRVKGKVVDVKGKPVAGIYVNANLQRDPAGSDELMELRVANSIRRGALTNERGEFELAPLAPGTYQVNPEEYNGEPSLDGRSPTRPLPAVFVPMSVTLKDGEKPETLEVRAVPHVLVEAQYLDSKGKPTRGHDCFVFGQMDGNNFWHTQGRANADGKIVARVPHGLRNVRLDLMTNEHGVLRHRKAPNGPLSNRRQVDLGTLTDDVKGIEVIRYVAPILLVKVVAKDGYKLKNVQVSAAYPEGKNQFGGKLILKGGLNSDVSFEEQEDGRFRSSQLFPDEEVTITGHAEGYKTASQKVKLPEGTTKEITITLEKQ
jgi:beta-lactamase regulating signal transducer with metallopeptidase domain